MVRLTQFAQLGLAAAMAMASASAVAFEPVPDGIWEGTVKCEGRQVDPAAPKFNSGELAVRVMINSYDNYAFVTYLSDPEFYRELFAPYFPDAKHAEKGILAFGAESPGSPEGTYETGQLKLEGKRDGSVKLDGKSFIVSANSQFGVPAMATCEWKLDKVADPPV